jgi:pSer/pThr/pTyr-binding forkhead associated (FHA) protein
MSPRRPWRIFIGRSPHSDLVLGDPTVSRVHAVVLREGGSWTIMDLDSANGVRVNGARVKQAVLGHGDVIEVGRVRLVFGPQLGAGEAAPERTASRASA